MRPLLDTLGVTLLVFKAGGALVSWPWVVVLALFWVPAILGALWRLAVFIFDWEVKDGSTNH
jgi:hypothetical protein